MIKKRILNKSKQITKAIFNNLKETESNLIEVMLI